MEQSEFRALAQAHQDMVYRIALNFFRNPQDAEDVTQDVLLRLYLRQEPFDGPDHPRSWLIQVTLNRCRSLWRAPWRRRQVPLDELTASIPFQGPEESGLFQAVMALPRRHRTVLYLFYYEDLSVAQIARLLRISTSAVTTRLSRARKALKQAWTEDECHGL